MNDGKDSGIRFFLKEEEDQLYFEFETQLQLNLEIPVAPLPSACEMLPPYEMY